MNILCALQVLIVAILVTTITSLYDLTMPITASTKLVSS